MAYISKVTLPSGDSYDVKDAEARSLIEALESYTDYLGVTTTALSDGDTTNPIAIVGEDEPVTAIKGNIANYQSAEFVFNGTSWAEFGDLSGLGALAFEDEAEVAGTATAQVFTGTQATIESTSESYTPEGSVSLTTSPVSVVNGITEATTANIKEVDDEGTVTAGSAASFTQGTDTFAATVENETLTLNFTQGTDTFVANTPTAVTLPSTKSTSVVTAQGTVTSGSIDVPTSAAFTGTTTTIDSTATYTPAGTNGTSTVTGTAAPATP